MNTISIIALILIFLGGIGAILLTIGQSISSAGDKNEIINTTKTENIELKNQLAELKDERKLLNDSLSERDRNISEQNKEIISLNKKLAEKSEYIQNYVTGGKGYPILDIAEFFGEKNSEHHFAFKIENKFDFPLSNIQIEVFDYEAVKSKAFYQPEIADPFIKYEDLKTARVVHEKIDEMPAHQHRYIDQSFQIRPGKYSLSISSRSQSINEKIVVKEIDNRMYVGIQIFDSKAKMIEELLRGDMSSKIKTILRNELNTIPNPVRLNLSK